MERISNFKKLICLKNDNEEKFKDKNRELQPTPCYSKNYPQKVAGLPQENRSSIFGQLWIRVIGHPHLDQQHQIRKARITVRGKCLFLR